MESQPILKENLDRLEKKVVGRTFMGGVFLSVGLGAVVTKATMIWSILACVLCGVALMFAGMFISEFRAKSDALKKK